MRRAVLALAIAASALPSTASAHSVKAVANWLGFHRCYYEKAAEPKLRAEARLVLVSPGYWEHALRPGAYEPMPGSSGFYMRDAASNGPRPERTVTIWHAPIYMPVREETVIDPGQTTYQRADYCWPN